MEPRIETLAPKKLVGLNLEMSFANNRTPELWRSFMPRRKEITNSVTTDLISMQVYGPTFDFTNFDPTAPFTKWATTEVGNFDAIPEGMEGFELPGGLYVVFLHVGDASTGPQIFGYIYGVWLPNSSFELDNRPHFELLGEKYKNNDPSSEEEIWIPIKHKA